MNAITLVDGPQKTFKKTVEEPVDIPEQTQWFVEKIKSAMKEHPGAHMELFIMAGEGSENLGIFTQKAAGIAQELQTSVEGAIKKESLDLDGKISYR